MGAWITREWTDPQTGKRKREQVDIDLPPDPRDRFVVEWLEPSGGRRREKVKGRGFLAKCLAVEKMNYVNTMLSRMKHRAWVFQDSRQKAKHGTDKCPWSVGWLDSLGKRRSKRIGDKLSAMRYAREVETHMAMGDPLCRNVTWESGKRHYLKKSLEYIAAHRRRRSLATRDQIVKALDHFERLCKPRWIHEIDASMIGEFAEKRSREECRGKQIGPSTVNRDLKYVRLVLNKFVEWGMMTRVPEFKMLNEGPPCTEEWTYFVQGLEGGDIKIGYTKGPPYGRLRSLDSGSPVPLKIIGLLAGDQEKKMHLRFASHRSRGEWFRPASELLQFIAVNAQDSMPPAE